MNSIHKLGAICYALWGLLHIIGAAVLLLQASGAGATAVFATIGSATPAGALSQLSSTLADKEHRRHKEDSSILCSLCSLWLNLFGSSFAGLGSVKIALDTK